MTTEVYTAFRDGAVIGEYTTSADLPAEACRDGTFIRIYSKKMGTSWFEIIDGQFSQVGTHDLPDWINSWLLIL